MLFAVFSVAAALSRNTGELIVGRAAMGAAAALIYPATLALFHKSQKSLAEEDYPVFRNLDGA